MLAKAFQPTRAYEAMQCSALAYGTVGEARAVRLDAAVSMIENKESDTQVMVFDLPQYSIAAFRGTQASENTSGVDILRNTKFFKRDWFDGSRVHRGYGDGVDSVLGPLQDWIADTRQRGAWAMITGHSMGGTEACAATLKLNPDVAYTFGAPRTGDRRFTHLMKSRRLYRVVHAADIAPSWPHRLLGYRHAGERWQLSSGGVYSRPTGWWHDFFHYPYLEGKSDHPPHEYLQATRLASQGVDDAV